mgnify:CR=1 FL=1
MHWKLRSAVTGLNTALATLSGGIFLILSAVMVYDIVARAVGWRATGYTDVFSSLAMVLGATWTLGYALHVDAHVKVELLTTIMGSQLKRAAAAVALVSLFTFSLVLTTEAWNLAIDSWQVGAYMPQTIFPVKLAVPQFAAAFGYSLFTLQIIVEFVALAQLKEDLAKGGN